MKSYTRKEISDYLKGYKKHGGSVRSYAELVGVKLPTMNSWIKRNNFPTNGVAPGRKPGQQKLGGESIENEPLIGEITLEDQIRILKEVIIHKVSMNVIAQREGIKSSQIGYWRKKWIQGDIIIPGLVPTKEATQTRGYGRRTSAPLKFDHSAQIEIGKLEAKMKFLMELLEENGIEYRVDKITGKAKDNYILEIIKSHGIDIEISNGVAA